MTNLPFRPSAISETLASSAGLRGLRPPPRRLSGTGDLLFVRICKSAAIMVIVLAVLLVIVLVWKSWESITVNGFGFLVGRVWDPEQSHRIFGALSFVYGTVATSILAMLIAVPLGIGTAAYLAEIAPGWLRRIASFLVEMLAAIPSIIYGFWGMYFLAPRIGEWVRSLGGEDITGLSIFSAGIVLAIMIVPYITAVSYDVCRAVPSSQRLGALALGATRWQMIWTVILPYARPGIIGACFLALGRAIGETMAVTMLIGNRPEINLTNPFAPGYSIASVIANEFTEATYPLYLSALAELGLVLLVVSAIFNTAARLLIWRMGLTGQKRSALGVVIGFPFRVVWGIPAILLSIPSALRRFVPRKPRSLTPGTNQAASAAALNGELPRPIRWSRLVNSLMTGVLGSCMLVVLIPLFLILGYLFIEGIGSLSWDFFIKNSPGPGEEGGGMANALLGSAMLVGLATLFAVPLGLFAAIYLAEYRSGWLGSAVRFIGELLSGVPSVVVGIFAYALLCEPFKIYGWGGIFALAVMMIPIVMRASEESLKLVPRSLRDASYALGASRWQTVLRVTVPAAMSAIITGVFLAIARIAGETAPLYLTAGDNSLSPRSPSDYTPSLPVKIFVYATGPYENWHRQAWAAALVLLALVMLLNFGIRFVTGKRAVMATRAD